MTDSGIGKNNMNSEATIITIIVFVALALYNVAELNFIIFATFKRRGGLYFWSFFISTWGIAFYSIGFLIKGARISDVPSLYVSLIVVGWCSMVTGQSVVLYSRLHLVLRNKKQLRAVLVMIIVVGIFLHTPIVVMIYGSNSANPEPFLIPYSITEKVQVTIFFIQELIISGLYIIHTIKILRPEGNIRGKGARNVMTHLIWVNVIVVVLDITILGLEYSGLYDIQTAYKGLVYSIKLKAEFSILNRLVELTSSSKVSSNHNSSDRHVQMGIVESGRFKRHTAEDSSRMDVLEQDDSTVYMTTEVKVHRQGDEEHPDVESGQNTHGLGRKASSSSSQANFAHLGQ
ncbi:integral membrane protein [Halenospora varia]|nr:integral membrane protein [Halenospora varia]